MSIDLKKIDLQKKIIFDLTKKIGIENQKAQVVLVMDKSGSMDHLYQSGYVQRVLERIVPVAMQFDDNQEFELYLFQNNCTKHNNNVNVKNVDGIVNREIINRYGWGGTSYAPPIKMIQEDYVPGSAKKSGFLSAFSKEKTEPLKYPVYVIFITDGENSDQTEASEALKKASNYGIFFQFIGIGNENFRFLKKLDDLSGRLIDNANFFQAQDIDKMSDEELYSKLLGEFPQWLKEAKSRNLIA